MQLSQDSERMVKMAAFCIHELTLTEIVGSEAFNRSQLLGRQALTHDRVITDGHGWAGRRALRVLVVDDDKDTADGLVWLVRRWGHAARMAYDGAGALRVAADQHPDIVLLDVEMPLIDGCHVARQLRLASPRRECFIIAITGGADERGRRQCLEAGIDLVLIKPVDSSVVETLLMLECERVNRSPTDDPVGLADHAAEKSSSPWHWNRKITVGAVMKKEVRDVGLIEEDARVRDGGGRGWPRTLAQSHSPGSHPRQGKARF
jgi:CheY-like chemotaxis protein